MCLINDIQKHQLLTDKKNAIWNYDIFKPVIIYPSITYNFLLYYKMYRRRNFFKNKLNKQRNQNAITQRDLIKQCDLLRVYCVKSQFKIFRIIHHLSLCLYMCIKKDCWHQKYYTEKVNLKHTIKNQINCITFILYVDIITLLTQRKKYFRFKKTFVVRLQVLRQNSFI